MQASVEGQRLFVEDLSSDWERFHATRLAGLLMPGSEAVEIDSVQKSFNVELAPDVLGATALRLFGE